MEGVVRTAVGYTGGSSPSPTYQTVCAGDGHTEAVRIEYDPGEVSYEQLLEAYWVLFVGPGGKCQYRSAIWYHNEEQKRLALESLRDIREAGRFDDWMVSERAVSVEAASDWHDAEPYHQHHSRRGWSRKW
mmetsp:Transcript_45393/g.131432  ORF Transcript_45393/g.131432 Transcript_45393/m.131432 type:complete len:131 (-) Transcript_45393:141-533(-)